MYKCNLCDRNFSRGQDLTQHRHRLYSNNKLSRTVAWVQDQQLNLQPTTLPQAFNNNVWDIEGFVCNADNDHDEDNGDDSEKNDNIGNNTDDGENTKSLSEHDKSIRSQDNKSTLFSEDFRGVSLADAYEELNNINIKQILWPSDAYKEFMTIVTQYHLSDAAADSVLHLLKKYCNDPLPGSTKKGRTFMDNVNIKGLCFKEKSLITFEGKLYKLQYRPIFDAIKSLVSNADLNKDFLFDYNEQWELGLNGTYMRVYSEQNTADWWRERQMPFSKILAIMIYIDGTTLDTLGRKSEYPIFLTLGNIPNSRRNSPDAKVLVGFLPHLTTRDSKLRNSKEFKQVQRDIQHRALKYLLSPLLNENGIYLAIDEYFTAYLSTVLADMLEAQSICYTYKSYCTRCSCYKCLTSGEQWDTTYDIIISYVVSHLP
ncbi:unnamed protein product [Rhizophagus irregularis]|nr:unnamed protein product [Rhizophagus irregularis]